MRKLTITFTLAFAIISAFLPLTALSLDSTEINSLITSLPRGETIKNDGNTYVWLPTLKAFQAFGKTSTSDLTVTTADRKIVGKKGPFTIYQLSASPEKIFTHSAGAGSGYPVALNLNTNSLAVVTGNIWLKLKNMRDSRPIGDEYGLAYSFSNATMATSFYSLPPDADINALLKKLQADPRVLRVTLDMIDRIRYPR